MSNSLVRYPATATALSVGTSIAFAGLPLFMVGDVKNILHHFSNGWLTAIIFVLLFVFWLLADRLLFKKLLTE
jgi:hypothetical protein